ncbi:deoxyribose-phosphate aldolase [Mycotypha africana]|uniref:deoxyribose-phosphate aldolase n=1 Tax=Mycotypha africana TaxID=64632 RepID=UPI002300BD09|nr:deoxyribose-phosphate aldolase [Mycotypha africana]KAI8979186.1 deoxyribose-phosphate aldolase [Mycotypha africana]
MTIQTTLTAQKLGKYFDHAVLRPDQTTEDVIKGCEVAKKYNLASVCVKPCDVSQACKLLEDTDVDVGTVISFPHGNSTTEAKVAESLQAIQDGAVELDVVINIGFVKSGLYEKVQQELKKIVDLSKEKKQDVCIKVIFETAYLTNDEIVKTCELCMASGVDYVKTSTGFGPGGATYEHIELMRKTVPNTMGVKASGGIKTLEQVLKYIELGATRIGSSSSGAIIEEFKAAQK